MTAYMTHRKNQFKPLRLIFCRRQSGRLDETQKPRQLQPIGWVWLEPRFQFANAPPAIREHTLAYHEGLCVHALFRVNFLSHRFDLQA
jgi:hypothetical protein